MEAHGDEIARVSQYRYGRRMTEAERTAEIERLEAKLRASEGREGMSERVKAIKAALEELRNDAG